MSSRWKACVKALVIIGAVTATIAGVTFAIDANAPHATLAANEVSAASADLQIGANANSLAASMPGFKFNNMIPGHTTDGYQFTLKNTGLVALVVTAHIPTDLSGSTLDPAKVTMTINNLTDGGNTNPTIADLAASNVPLQFGSLTPGQSKDFQIRVTMSPNLSGNGPFSLTPFDLVFTGTQP